MIYVLSGGQTGATLTVNSSGAGTITVSNATLGKSYSKSVAAGGSAVFKGLQTGTWTVTLTDGSKTSTKTITITSDYSTNIAYFSASINITYPATSTCVVKNSGGQTVASNSNTGTSAKTWTATVNASGTYTVTATATDGSGDSASETVGITTEGQNVSIELNYNKVLYSNGNEYIQNSGGWGIYNGSNGTSTLESGYINFSSNAAGTAHQSLVYSETSISRGEYTKLCFDIDIERLGDNNTAKFGICNSKPTNYNASFAGSVTPSSTGRQTITFDVSSYSTFYVAMYSQGLASKVYKIWLE